MQMEQQSEEGGSICSLGEPGHIVRDTEVHDGLKFQEKYLQRESAKKIFFSIWKILET